TPSLHDALPISGRESRSTTSPTCSPGSSMVIPAAGSTRSGVGRASALHATTTPIWIKNRHQALQHGCFADQINQPLVPHDNHGHHLELGGSLYWSRSQTRDRNRARQLSS